MARGQANVARADFIWKTPAPPRVKLFIWLLLQRRIQCRTLLFKKHVVDNPSCEICQAPEESPEHIMWGCDLGKQVWSRLGIVFQQDFDVSALYSISPPTGVPLDLFPASLRWFAGRFGKQGIQKSSTMKLKPPTKSLPYVCLLLSSGNTGLHA